MQDAGRAADEKQAQLEKLRALVDKSQVDQVQLASSLEAARKEAQQAQVSPKGSLVSISFLFVRRILGRMA